MVERPPRFDYVPTGVPPVTNGEIDEAIEAAKRGRCGEALAWEAMLDEQVRQLETDRPYRRSVRDVYRQAGVDVVSPTVWSTDPRLPFSDGVYEDLTRWEGRFAAVPWMEKTDSADAMAARSADDAVGFVLNVQDLGSFTDGDPSRVDVLYNAGVRIAQLTYNKQNSIGAGCTDASGSGLSSHGHTVVDRLNERGMIVDLSHCNRETTFDAIDASAAPVAFTHVHCGALSTNPRGKSDEELRRLADVDGYVGVLIYPTLYDDPTFETFFEHFEHAKSIVGDDRIGIATDWCTTTPDVPEAVRPALVSFFRGAANMREKTPDYDPLTPERFDEGFEEFRDYSDWPVIEEEFERRGYSGAEIDGFLGGNFLDFWAQVETAPS